MTYILVYLTFTISLLTVSWANGNYGYGQQLASQGCDQNAYTRSKEMVRLEIQLRSSPQQQQPPSQYGYPPLTSGYQGNSNSNQFANPVTDHQCK